MEINRLQRLTEAQRVALRMYMERKTAKEIALELGISPKAVELRLKSARENLGVSTSIEAARILAAHEGAPPYRQTLGGQTEVADSAQVPSFRATVAHDNAAADAPNPLVHEVALTAPPVEVSARIKGAWLPLPSEGRPTNDLSLGWRLVWPFILLAALLIGTGLLVSSVATLSQMALSFFGKR